jgi:hypothetical protein
MKGHFEIFPYVWLGIVSMFGIVSLIWGFYELRRGSARWGWMGVKYAREDEPFYYWMAVLARFAGFLGACLMFYMGLDMFSWQ